jgi:sulfate permease, SulP family
VHLLEMVGDTSRPFREQEVDEDTGRSRITMLQIEGPLFFAHADDLAEQLRDIFERGPSVVILRMRRTQQIDFSVLAALDRVVRDFRAAGGHVIVCGLSSKLRRRLLDSPLGRTVGPDFLLETTREVFGSAHLALGLAESILDLAIPSPRPRFRLAASKSANEIEPRP